MKGNMVTDDELIDLIYGALLGETSWQKFLERLADSAPDGKTVLVMHDNKVDHGYIPLAAGISKETLSMYNGYFSTINPFMRPAKIRPVGIGLIDEDLLPKKDIERTEFFNDLLKPNGMPSRIALTIDRDTDYQFILASLGERFDEERKIDISDQLTRLYPHLKRASEYYRKGSDARAASELGASIFDAIDIGLLIVGDGFRIKAISEMGKIIIQNTSLLSISPIGSISIRDKDTNLIANNMLSRTYDESKVITRVIDRLKITFIRIQRDAISLFFDGPTLIMLIENIDYEKKIDTNFMQSSYSLSKAEVRALIGLVDGKSASVIASENGVSRETIRSQIKSLYAKTGAHSQSDLLRIVKFGRYS